MTIAGSSAPAADSPSSLPQVRDYYRSFLRPAFTAYAQHGLLATWLRFRLPPAAAVSLPSSLLYLMIPAGLLARRTPFRIAIALSAITVPLAYILVPIYLMHYGLIAAPAFILLVVMGAEIVARASRARAAVAVAIATLAIASLPEVRRTHDHFLRASYLIDIDVKLSALDHKPAVVLFTYHTGNDVHEEPVYNLDTPWPDDTPVIRAQDRGDDNRRIFAYYAARQPDRFFYRYDRATAELVPLGWAKDLVNAPLPQDR